MKALLVFLLLAFPVQSIACELMPTEEQAFAEIKKDYATRETFKGLVSLGGSFDDLDYNKDGKVTKEEYSRSVSEYYRFCDKIQNEK